MPFTIEVEPMASDDEFRVQDLELYHAECGGGPISWLRHTGVTDWFLNCKRCGVGTRIPVSEGGTVRMAQTVLDGEQRTLSALYIPDGSVIIRQRSRGESH